MQIVCFAGQYVDFGLRGDMYGSFGYGIGWLVGGERQSGGFAIPRLYIAVLKSI